jgi:quercetin dioxygenase-like cupin family protein
MRMLFDLWRIATRKYSERDFGIARQIIGEYRAADLILAPDGEPYLYRWHVIPRNDTGNVYFHIQVRSDPERPLHDHPWDNTSVILAGGYDEVYTPIWGAGGQYKRELRAGDMVFRRAEEAHRLILPPEIPYTMTLFTTGPKRRIWGFHYPDGWVPNTAVCVEQGNVSYHKH